jgi:hypothetical protein
MWLGSAACRVEAQHRQKLTLPIFPRKLRAWRKRAAAQNGRADLPVSQDARQRVRDWHASHYVKSMLN